MLVELKKRPPIYEVSPTANIVEKVKSLPLAADIAITTHLPKGNEHTKNVAIKLKRLGYNSIPHVNARIIYSYQELVDDTLEEFLQNQIEDIFVIAGDETVAKGGYISTLSVFKAIQRRGLKFRRIGIAGYPEGHPFLTETRNLVSLKTREEIARDITDQLYLVSQLCFNPEAIRIWIEKIRSKGIDIPIYLGIAGPTDPLKLIRFAKRFNIDASCYFKRFDENGNKVISYAPEVLLEEILSKIDTKKSNIGGIQIYTLNNFDRIHEMEI